MRGKASTNTKGEQCSLHSNLPCNSLSLYSTSDWKIYNCTLLLQTQTFCTVLSRAVCCHLEDFQPKATSHKTSLVNSTTLADFTSQYWSTLVLKLNGTSGNGILHGTQITRKLLGPFQEKYPETVSWLVSATFHSLYLSEARVQCFSLPISPLSPRRR